MQTAISRVVFGSIRVINTTTRFTVRAIANVVEAGLVTTPDPDDLTTSIQESTAGSVSRHVDSLQALINGFWGNTLSRRMSHLDLGMTLRLPGSRPGPPIPVTPRVLAVAFPNPTNKICVFVHGLAGTERLWSLSSEQHYGNPGVTFGSRLLDDLGYTPIYLRYNTGRHISENGRQLAELLSKVLAAYPVPLKEVALVGHSLGGLVVRSAAHYARQHDEPWIPHLRHVACLASPHLGAPLEKAVSLLTGALRAVEAAGAQVPAELLDSRSAGIKDLRYGYTIDEEWAGKNPNRVFADRRHDMPLIDGVGYYFLAATISRRPEHPLGQLLGDLMVRLSSAKGEALEPDRRIRFSDGATFPEMNHLQIANHPKVYEVLRELFASVSTSTSSAVALRGS
jgi:pimeloyl-ACP methyl ester carboxylesterase